MSQTDDWIAEAARMERILAEGGPTPRKPINRETREAVARRYGAEPGDIISIHCYYCRDLIWIDWSDPKRVRFLDRDDRPRPELDHVEPLYWGGPHTVENLVPACMSCNRKKGPRRLA